MNGMNDIMVAWRPLNLNHFTLKSQTKYATISHEMRGDSQTIILKSLGMMLSQFWCQYEVVTKNLCQGTLDSLIYEVGQKIHKVSLKNLSFTIGSIKSKDWKLKQDRTVQPVLNNNKLLIKGQEVEQFRE